MRILETIFIIFVLVFLNSCRKDFDTIKSNGSLSFSKDTIFLDTVFTNTSSSTRSFKVYNKSNSAITIPTIALARGENSFYRLNVDGIPGKSFENIDILAKDSLYVFVEATIDFTQVINPIYTDSIVFDAANNFQDVDLVTLVQDAHFLFPQRNAQGIKETIVLGQDETGNDIAVNGFLLADHTTWSDDKPYVIYGYVGVPSTKTLTIEAGAKIHFHANSGLLVQENASLNVNGTLGNEVVFEGDRLEPDFADIAGQWGTIWLREGSINSTIYYALIKNSVIGILVDDTNGSNPTLTIKNTQIYNTSNFGILGRQTNILGENLVISNSGQSNLACTIGGTYNFIHSTFANHWRGSIRDFPAVLVNNYLSSSDTGGNEVKVPVDLVAANFTNCIIDGSQNVEFFVDRVTGADFNFNVKNSMLKFDTTDSNLINNPLFDFTDTNWYQDVILNGFLHFKNSRQNELIIGQDSEAVANAASTGASQVPFDILGIDRTSSPDIGAYQHVILEEEEN
tara:strand:- start:705650 stop:707182 length:1533 start_codon:yes stop_codon:yes gene_type:complete